MIGDEAAKLFISNIDKILYGVAAVIAAFGNLVFNYLGYRRGGVAIAQSEANSQKMDTGLLKLEEVHQVVNGADAKAAELLRVNKEASFAQGEKSEREKSDLIDLGKTKTKRKGK